MQAGDARHWSRPVRVFWAQGDVQGGYLVSDATRRHIDRTSISTKPAAGTATSRIVSWFARAGGFFVIITSLGIAVIGSILLSILAENLRKNPEFREDIAPAAPSFLDARGWLPLLMLPALAMGCALAFAPRRLGGSGRWLLLILGNIWLLCAFLTLLWVFLSFVAPLYQMKPL
jgi:hypothetical protein